MSDYEKLLNLLLMFFYDADSSLGTDNKGNLAFDYYLEDIDYTDAGEPVYNGQNSVLWKNLRAAFYDEIAAEYKRLRTTIREDGTGRPLISYDVVNDKFENHQSIWSEAIYNEDGYRKCIEPLVLNGDTTYLGMLQGKKEQHRKWWLYNRFRYLDSKYVTGSSMDTRILIRAHAKGNVTLTSYVNMYGHVYYNAEMVEHRMFRGQPYEFVWAASGAEDTVIGINDADMLTSLGDLSQNMVETIDISAATHLTFLKLGDASESYSNANLNTLTLGNNTLLRSIDVRNCVSLAQAVDASGCTGLEEAYFDNTAITGLTLPNGAGIKVLHLPSTITNLTLRNCTALTEFVLPSYGNITTLRLENNSNIVDPLEILFAIPANSRVRIIGFDWEMTNSEIGSFLAKLDTMRGLDENGNNTDLAQVGGRIYVEEISGTTLAKAAKYVGLTVEYGTVIMYSTRLVERTLSGDYTNDRVTKIGQYAFAQSMIENVSFAEATEMEKSAFVNVMYKAHLVTGNFPKVKHVGTLTFNDQSNLTRLVLPSVETLDGNWLSRTSNLKILDLPSLKSAGYMAFYNATGLIALVLRRTDGVIPANSPNLCSSTPIASGTGYIYVPSALVESYKAATNWSTYAEQFRALEDYTVDGTVTGELDYEKMGVTIE